MWSGNGSSSPTPRSRSQNMRLARQRARPSRNYVSTVTLTQPNFLYSLFRASRRAFSLDSETGLPYTDLSPGELAHALPSLRLKKSDAFPVSLDRRAFSSDRKEALSVFGL